jgi:protein SCO1/2
MATNRNRRVLLLALAGLMAFGVGTGGYLVSRSSRSALPAAERPNGLLWPQVRALPAVELVDQSGERFETKDLEGRWSLIFFGYTSCPDICPMTLTILDLVQQRMAALDAGFGDLQTVLISVDPARDTPERLREYVRYFNEDFIGATGEHEQLQTLTRALGAVYMTDEPDATGDYLIHHSVTIFLITPQAELAGVLTGPHEPAPMAERLREMLDYMQANA